MNWNTWNALLLFAVHAIRNDIINNQMEIKGNFEKQLETKTGTGRNGEWEATSFMIEMIEVPGQYPKHPVFELFNNTDAIVGLQPGQPITVSFDLDSSEWNGKHFPKVKAFKVVREPSTNPGAYDMPAATPSVQQQYNSETNQPNGPALVVPNSAPVQDDLAF